MIASISLFVSLVSGWGGDGHRIITSLATRYMSGMNADWVSAQVGGDLNRASTWADTDEAETLYPISGAYHFSNTPYRKCAAFDMKRDCGFGKTKGICIVTGLSEAISRATDPNSSEAVRADSLKFILHLMADIHQPLHTGFREDTGGLRVILSEPEGVDLHRIWDSGLINELKLQRGASDWSELLDYLSSRLGSNNGTFVQRVQSQHNFTEILDSESRIVDYVSSIASETSLNTTCKSAYKVSDTEWIGVGDALTSEYIRSRLLVAIVQLLKASVRLGSLLDAVADKFFSRRQIAKETRREERVAKLFERKDEVVEVDDRLLEDSNRFAPLFIDFDPENSEYNPSVSLGSRPSVRATKPSTEPRGFSDSKLLGQAIQAAARERESYTFSGIDLSEIVHVCRYGTILVSYKSRLADPRYRPATVVVPVWFSGSGKPERHVFGFDATIFSTQMRNTLVIRVILKLSGIDPRIDITDYMDSIRTESVPGPVPSYIRAKLMLDHSRRQESAVAKKSVIDEIRKLGVDILFMPITLNSYLFVRLDTMKARVDREGDLRQRFNRFLIGGIAKFNIWIDPLIFDRTPESSEVFTVLRRLGMKTSATALKYSKTRLLRELEEVETFLASHDSGIRRPEFLNGTLVDWVFDYPGDTRKTYHVIEWFRKGNLTTTEHLMEYLGIVQRLPGFNESMS